MDNGWISLHRKLLDNPIYKNPAWLSVWITLLLLASHKEKDDFIWNGKILKLNKGQFITGRKNLKELTNIPETTIERALTYLEKSGHQIEQQKTTKFRLITILNWDKYQKLDIKSDNRRTTDGQQTDTINKGNKDNNETTNDVTAKPLDEVNTVFNLFYKTINPNINFANKTERSAAEWLINRYGLEKTISAAEYAISVQNDKYAPTITTPLQLKDKMAALAKHKGSKEQPKKGYLKL
jgi:biotin operon repressor